MNPYLYEATFMFVGFIKGLPLEIEEGSRVSLRGTVKDHTEYRDEKQTALIRCKVVGL